MSDMGQRSDIAREEYELLQNDSKYRLYVTSIDRALRNFESTTEWADLISALGKLNKVIGQNAKFQIIPRRIKISKRLAQCMHPNLPFGVHLKALETYDLIFKSMGTNRLSQELFIYSAGLFPLFGYCAMKVRPDLLVIYETHFVPLGHRLRPALPGFLSGVLPGFEESSDHYARTNQLLETVCEGVGPTHFYGCIWDCIASNSNVRNPATQFVLSHFDKKHSMEDQPHIMGNDIETMVCGLIACVQDSKVLVQRCALDLLILGFPLYNSHLTTDDMIRLVTAALSTILRRDQSLNRRMYGWLLGTDVNMTMLAHYPQLMKAKAEHKPLTYFEVFSKHMLVKALKIILDNSIGVRPFDLKPYKLLISLLDRDGVGPAILDDILFEYFRLLYLSCNADPKVDLTELLDEANLLFGNIEPKFLWNYIGQLFSKACSNPQSTGLDVENPVRRVASGDVGVVEICTLTEFLLDKVSTFDTSADTPSKHLPGLFLQVVTLLADHCNELTSIQIVKGLKLCTKILTRVQPVIVGHRNIGDEISDSEPSDSSIVNSVSFNQNDSVSSDFNQNTDSSSIDDKSELPRDDVEPLSEKSDSLPEQCMRQYEKFYVTFMYSVRRRVGELRQVEFLLENLKVSSYKSNEERSKQFDNLLDDVLHSSRNSSPEDREPYWSNPEGKEWVDPMKIASRLLVDLSTLKTFFRSPIPQSVLESEGGLGGGDNAVIDSLPEWLRTLMTCTFWFNNSADLQIVSIGALLDLVTLCTTAQTLANNSTSDDGATTVLIVPLLTPVHLKYMEKNTFIFQVMSHWLWQQLGEIEHKVQSVELLHQLHSVFPHNGIVETCIGQYLKSPIDNKPSYDSRKLESFRKFAALWHIGREVNARQGNALRVSDIFYKSMLKMLDNLKLPGCNCLKIEAQEWLLHSLQRGDIHRILDPLLFMLLDSSTARLSVLHIRLSPEDPTPQQVQSPTLDNRNVTAVSSVDGVITYHGGPKKENSKTKADRFISAVSTAIASPPVRHRQKYVSDKREDNSDHKDKENNQSISLYVNPFSSVSSTINTDFDEFFEETDDTSLKDSVKTEPLPDGHRVIRNRSFPSLEKEVERKSFGITDAVKISSLDLLKLSDTIMTRVSDGELPFTRLNRGSFSSDGISQMVSSLDSGEVVRSWTFPNKEVEGSDPEESTAADEYFSSGTQDSMSVIEDIMNDLLNKVTQLSDDSSETKKERQTSRRVKQGRKLNYQSTITSHSSGVDSLHSHMLLYRNIYDADGALYCLETLRNILLQQPRAFLVSSSTTGLVSRSPILKLLARHKKSLFGRGFSGDLEETNIRSAMYLEVMMMVCLYYLRSYYPNLETLKLSQKNVIENKEVQISSAEVLTLLCSELIRILRESSRSLACYLSDLFSRLKLYKVVLHTVITSLHHQKYNSPIFTHQVLKFNEGFDNSRERMSQHSETLLKQQIKLLLSLIILEFEIIKHKGDTAPTLVEKPSEPSELKYLNGRLIPHQPLFLQSINKALDVQAAARHTHGQWTDLITCALPYLGGALSKVVTTALKQICHNIEVLSECYSSSCSRSFPADYGIKQLEALTIMCHYCLLDTSAAFNQSNSAADDLSNTQVFNNLTHLFMPPPTQTEQSRERLEAQAVAKKSVLGHLPRVIASISVLWHALVNRKDRDGENCEVGSPLVVKQKIVEFLSPLAVQHASSFLAAMAVVWRERRQPSTSSLSNVVLPEASDDQKVLVQLLIGIKAMPIHVLVQTLHQVVKQPALNQESAVTVEVSALELFVNYAQHVPTPSLLDSWPSLIHLFKEAPSLSPPAQFLLIGALSQFVHRAHITDKKDQKELQDITVKLIESCTTIVGACLEQTTWIRKNLAVREEDPIVTPDKEDRYYDDLESTEIDFNIDELQSEGKSKKNPKSKLKRVTRKIRQDAEKLQVRDMHRWFMRAFVNDSNLPLDYNDRHKSGSNSLGAYSISALNVLAQLLAPLLDVTFGSQEKERVVTILNNLMVNIVPYLKNHTQRNAASYYACSQLLASLSTYQYTRKAWKKDVIDLMFDSLFFQMEPRSLKSWQTIIDNLINQEAATFRDFMNRVSMPQGSSFAIFSSKDQEYEQRAQLLKRLAFVIYCSDIDRFATTMPEFQERLAESTKIPHMGVLAQVFLCFRVMLLRMSPSIIIPLWPTIISEILQVMILMEHDLSSDFETFRYAYFRLTPFRPTKSLDAVYPRLSFTFNSLKQIAYTRIPTSSHESLSSNVRALMSTDWNWGGNNGPSSQALWLQLQLAAANLLFLAVQLPADRLPQFQMYRWAFVGGDNVNSSRSPSSVAPDFVPHVVKIAELMDLKSRLPCVRSHLILRIISFLHTRLSYRSPPCEPGLNGNQERSVRDSAGPSAPHEGSRTLTKTLFDPRSTLFVNVRLRREEPRAFRCPSRYTTDVNFGTLEAVPTPLLPSSNQLSSVEDLHPFFCAMRSGRYTPLTVAQVEHQLELDILDTMAPR